MNGASHSLVMARGTAPSRRDAVAIAPVKPRRYSTHAVRLSALLPMFLCCASHVDAQERQRPPATEAPKHVRAAHVAPGTITIDGRLSEAAWQQAAPAEHFIQQQPAEGSLATEASEVRFLFDEEN